MDALTGLVNLERLNASFNQISDISCLTMLTNLKILYLRSNEITDISPLIDNEGIGFGDKVYLKDNPLSETSINEYIPALEERGVEVSY
jgi:Leucine-rich repeat (LRR) protein